MPSDQGAELPPVEGKTVVYTTIYKRKGSALTRQQDVHVTEGYSTFEDIRKILAVWHGLGNGPDGIAQITILSTELDETKGY
jgi:hypothetical protein